MIIAGMGELHLEIIVDRLKREHKVEANVGKPQVAYRETVTRVGEAEGKYIRQTGGKGQYGHVKLRISPAAQGAGFSYRNRIAQGVVPKEFFPAIEAGVQSALSRGVVAGFQIIDVAVEVLDGSFHEVDSDEIAFQIAASMAFQDACKAAEPTLLEPVMKVEVVVPMENNVGGVIGDISTRRGEIRGMSQRHHLQVIDAEVPLSEMFGYVDALRSLTGGYGNYTMHFGAYTRIPPKILQPLLVRLRGY